MGWYRGDTASKRVDRWRRFIVVPDAVERVERFLPIKVRPSSGQRAGIYGDMGGDRRVGIRFVGEAPTDIFTILDQVDADQGKVGLHRQAGDAAPVLVCCDDGFTSIPLTLAAWQRTT